MPKHAITRSSVFLDASLKAQVDALSAPRLRTTMPICRCGACTWTPCRSTVASTKDYYTCNICSRRRSATRVLASVTSAIDGSGTVDRMIQEYLKAPRKLEWHVPEDRVMVSVYMPVKSHEKANAAADKWGVSLSCLLASIIAAKVLPLPQKQEAA